MSSNTLPLFVYGTLRDGQDNSRRFGLSGNLPVETNVVLTGFTLHDISWFPGIRRGEGSVVGDVFEVPISMFGSLDQYEGTPHLYTREIVNIAGKDTQVYVYASEPPLNSLIANGDWLNKDES